MAFKVDMFHVHLYVCYLYTTMLSDPK